MSRYGVFSGLYFLEHAFFISNTFISNARLKLAKNQAKVNQQPEDELLLLEHFFIHVTIQKLKDIFLKMYKKQVTLFKCGYMINDNENEAEIEK